MSNLIRWSLLFLLASFPALAAPRDCSEAERGSDFTVVRSAADLAKVDGAKALKLWIGPDKVEGDKRLKLPAAALKKLKLAPESVLIGLDLGKADLAGWKAPGVEIVSTDLTGANLAGADLAGACFDHSELVDADLSRAVLGGASSSGTAMGGANFTGADLTAATLACSLGMVGEGCDFSDDKPMKLTRAKLANANIAEVYEAQGGDLTEAEIDGTTFAVDSGILTALARAKLASVVLQPPAFRLGSPERFTAAEIAQLRKIAGDSKSLGLDRVGATPSFDCAAKLTLIEKAICEMGDLAALDRIMAMTYRLAGTRAADRQALQAAQGVFLKHRNDCAREKEIQICIADAYVARLGALARDMTKESLELVPADGRLFTGAPLALPANLKDEPLMRRLLAAHGVSIDQAEVKREGDKISLHAQATGANGHVCDSEATLSRDPKTGFWTDPADDEAMSWVVLPGAVINASSNEISRNFCGMRASWPAVFFAPD